MATLDTPKITAVLARLPAMGGGAWQQVREYAPTFATEFAVMASQIITYKLAAYFLGKQGFSEYAVLRRTVSFLAPIPLLGLGVGLPRFIAQSRGRLDPAAADRYFGAALWWVLPAVVLFVLAMNIAPGYFALLFFGAKSYAEFVFPVSVMVFGYVLHSIGYAYCRGHLAMHRANLLQLVNLAAAPLVAFVFCGKSVSKLMLFIGISWASVALLALSLMPIRSFLATNYREAKELGWYGVQRLPGDFFIVALTTLPVTLVAHQKGIEAAGLASFGMSMISIVGALFAPIGLILLPKASRLFASGDQELLKKDLLRITIATIGTAGIIVVCLELFSPAMVRIYLGTGYEDLVPIVRVLALGALPYAAYFVWRGVIDAFHLRALNAINAGIALVVYLAATLCFGWAQSGAALMIPVVIGFYVLGSLTAIQTYRIWAQKAPKEQRV